MKNDQTNPLCPPGIPAKEYLETRYYERFCNICHGEMVPCGKRNLIWVGGMTGSLFHEECYNKIMEKYRK